MINKNKKSPVKAIITVLVLVSVIAVATVFSVRAIYKHIYPRQYTEYIEKYSKEYSVPEELLYATIKVESGFDKNAKSSVGAMGLTQIMPDTLMWLQTKTGESYTAEDLYDPEVSVKYCAVLYRLLLDKFGDTKTAIAAYHSGINQVDKWLDNEEYSPDGKSLENTPSKATNHYISKVTKAVNIYGNLYKEE